MIRIPFVPLRRRRDWKEIMRDILSKIPNPTWQEMLAEDDARTIAIAMTFSPFYVDIETFPRRHSHA